MQITPDLVTPLDCNFAGTEDEMPAVIKAEPMEEEEEEIQRIQADSNDSGLVNQQLGQFTTRDKRQLETT